MSKPDSLTKSLLDTNGQNSGMRSSNQSSRAFYPAIVVNVDDPTGANRIVCRIINLDQNGNILGGRDRDVQDNNLVLCLPGNNSHLVTSVFVGEMVWVVLENPDDNSSNRLWFGPIFSSMLNAKSELYRSVVKIMDKTPFSVNKSIQNSVLASSAFPQPGDVGLIGRGDASLILRNKEVYLYASAFNQESFTPNSNVAYLDLKQYSGFTQTNLVSDSINIYSTKGKFMSATQAKYEINPNLSNLNSLAQALQPGVLGASLVECLNLIIQLLLNHIHTPQKPLVQTQLSKQLAAFTLQGRLQELLSNYIRIN
jgi:hypothetical protein